MQYIFIRNTLYKENEGQNIMNVNDDTDKLPHNSDRIKRAALWARVSTHDQREVSLPNQIDRCKAKLEEEGYTIAQTLFADWTSTDLFSCPEFQELRSLIKGRAIDALGVFDRDRLEAKGLQRLIFLSECKEAGIKLVICQGAPILDEPEGQLVELALAIGKERQVLRARQGSKDGLHDRVLKRRLPTSRHRLYGYRWEGDRHLVPDDKWSNLKLIFDMLLEGATYKPIIQELKKRGIASPSGMPEWNKAALSQFVHNPAYAGRYFALKKQAIEPVRRNGNTYGNSSQKQLAIEESQYLPEIEIVEPPINWVQRLNILDQLAKHQKLAKRHAKRDYLLRGMIFCGTHTGNKGKPRAYHGQPHHNSWRYTCPLGGCAYPYVNGPKTEDFVKLIIKHLLTLEPEELYETLVDSKNQKELESRLRGDLASCEAKYEKCLRLEATLEHRFMNHEIDPQVYPLNKARYQEERKGIEIRKRDIQNQIEQIGREKDAILSIETLQSRFTNKLDSLTIDEWRDLISSLNVELHVSPVKVDNEKERTRWEKEKQREAVDKRFSFAYQWFDYGPFFITVNIPLEPNELDRFLRNIVSDCPAPG
jgi:DNA invertase Pin-like site-specific DNA recombinase